SKRKTLLYAGEAAGLGAWDAATGERLWRNEAPGWSAPPGEGAQLFTAEGASFFCASGRRILDTTSGKVLRTLPETMGGATGAISPDGKTIAGYNVVRTARTFVVDVATSRE